MERPPDRLASRSEQRRRTGRVVRLMPDTGVFPLWVRGGGLTAPSARDLLGLSDDLVADIWTWGQEEDSPSPPGGWDAWLARGTDLHQRLQAELGPDWDVEFKPE